MIYFDHNATSPLIPAACDAWVAATRQYAANPSSPHRPGARAEVALSAARQSVAELLGCRETDLVWTSGATEANNLVFFHCHKTSPGEAWISAVEHPSVLAAARFWFGDRVRLLEVTPQGMLDLNQLADLLKQSRPAVVAVMAANNEIGVLQPWPEALKLCLEHGVPFACDAAQWIGKQPSLGLGTCDFVTGCAHKFGGPLGIGFLKVPKNFQPLIIGGPQEDGRRGGTENLPGALSLAACWSQREERLRGGQMASRLHWRDQFIQDLKRDLPEIRILGERSPRLWNTVAALMPPILDCRRRWVVQLDKLGFAVSTGSACSSGKATTSHVLKAMNPAEEGGDRMLRFSSGWETTEQDWRQLLAGIKTAFENLSASA